MTLHNIIYTLLFFIFFVSNITAQICVPDPQYTAAGRSYPDTLPASWVGVDYNTVITSVVTTDTTIDISGLPTDVTVNFVEVTNVVGLPQGFTYQCEPSNCRFPGGTSGCILITGPAPSLADTGIYPLEIHTTTEGTASVLGFPVTDTQLDTATNYFIEIKACTINASEVISAVVCNGESNGGIDISVSGGVSPYQFNWSNGAQTEDVSSVIAGTYDVTVLDDVGCEETFVYNVGEPSALVLATSVTDATCGNSNGSATILASGGSSGYAYLWSDNQSNMTASSLSGGIYNVTVTDQNGCSSFSTAAVPVSNGPSISVTSSDVICNGDANGSITVIPAATTYSYNWSHGTTTMNVSGLSGGAYNLTVSDSNCDSYSSVIINENAALEVTLTSSDESAPGNSDGSATAVASGGTGSYVYNWNVGTGSTINNLTNGVYTITVIDGNNCTIIDSTTINTVPPVTCLLTVTVNGTDVTSNGGSDGNATAVVSGSQSTITYSWSNGETTSSIGNLMVGTYTVTVMDDIIAGCLDTGSVVIGEPIVSTLIDKVDDQMNLKVYPNPNNGRFLILISKKENYTISINNIVGQQVSSFVMEDPFKEINLEGVEKGLYFINAIDSSGKSRTKRVIIR